MVVPVLLPCIAASACAYDASGVAGSADRDASPAAPEPPDAQLDSPDAPPAPPPPPPPALADAAPAPPPPPAAEVDYQDDVLPVLSRRGCVPCHTGAGPGHLIGHLNLAGSADKIYKELTQEVSDRFHVPRVDLAVPVHSLLLTEPLLESPSDGHPVIFSDASDPDYLLLLGWIQAGVPED